jgi:hypothetical protein
VPGVALPPRARPADAARARLIPRVLATGDDRTDPGRGTPPRVHALISWS